MNKKSTNKSMPKDNRPPKHLRTLKRGDIREDGMIFWAYVAHLDAGEWWIEKDHYERKSIKLKEREKTKDNRPPKDKRVLKQGDVREDGMIFFCYHKHRPTGEWWMDKKTFDRKVKKVSKNARKYKKNNKEKLRAYHKERRKNPRWKLLGNFRSRITIALKDSKKADHSVELLGCTPNELKAYLESKFTDGMTFDNYGKYGWHIDHIKPCSSFDLSDPKQQKECFHYTNLQPLWAKDNYSKGSHYNPQTED